MMLTNSRLREYLQEHSLDALVETLQETLKKHPNNREARSALATVWCVEENWDKALVQADMLVRLADANSSQGELLKNLILSEKIREKVLVGERKASLLDDTSSEWIALLQRANQASARNEEHTADELRAQAFDLAPLTAGHSEHFGAFDWIADGDGRLGPVCEFICAGGYRWVPFEHIQSLTVHTPHSMLDLLWIPATLDTGDRKWNGYLPARYPQSALLNHNAKLGDETHWHQHSELLTTGEGRKMWLTDNNEYSILECGELNFRAAGHV
jgi:type VI secretion system protein ImpE